MARITAANKKAALLQALCDPANRTFAHAAAAAGVSDRTARQWRQESEFVAALDKAQAALLDEVAGRLIATLPAVESVFMVIMADKAAPYGARLRAAEGLADMALRLYEGRQIERRIAELEAARDAKS